MEIASELPHLIESHQLRAHVYKVHCFVLLFMLSSCCHPPSVFTALHVPGLWALGPLTLQREPIIAAEIVLKPVFLSSHKTTPATYQVFIVFA